MVVGRFDEGLISGIGSGQTTTQSGFTEEGWGLGRWFITWDTRTQTSAQGVPFSVEMSGIASISPNAV